MRVALLIVLVAAIGCGRNEAKGQTGSGGSQADEIAREQARFDAARRPEKVVEALGIKPGSRVADIGAGSGLLTVHLARAVKPGGKVVATDIDDDVLKLMHARLIAAGLDDIVERRVVTADTPGLAETGVYDAILLAEVDHYFGDPVAWLREAAKALKPGGRIVISNRIYRRQAAITAAQKAGLKLASESAPVETHYIAVFVVEDGK